MSARASWGWRGWRWRMRIRSRDRAGAHARAREMARDGGPQVRLIPAARIVTREGLVATALPCDRAGGLGRLCRLLTLGRRRAPKGQCDLGVEDLLDWGAGMALMLHPPGRNGAAWRGMAARLVAAFGPAVHLLVAPRHDGQDGARISRGARLAADLGVRPVASGLPMMHRAARRRLADVLTAIRLGCRVAELGRRALANAEARLRGEAEMLRLFAGHEDMVHRAGEIADDLRFSLDELRYEYPSEVTGGETAAGRLAAGLGGPRLALSAGRAGEGAGADGA